MAEGYSLGQIFGSGRSSQVVSLAAQPAVASDFVAALDARWIHRLIACTFTFTADVNAANRAVTVEYREGGGRAYCVDGRAIVITANQVRRFNGSVSRGAGEDAANADIFFCLTPVFLFPGDTLNIAVTNKQAGDQLSLIRFLFDRFPTGDGDAPGLSE